MQGDGTDGVRDPATAALRSALQGRYALEQQLGTGGMATVYLAEDVRHRRKVALKLLHPELSAVLGPDRFLREIELTAGLQHPHILPLFDSGSIDGQLYYVMPYMDGETLRARLHAQGQLPVAEAVRIAREVADALAYAHERGIVHRDIKPENILLHGGHALVADFGIALAVQSAGGTRMTQTGLSLGTPQYMAPEQAMGDRQVDARADIYALGAITYEMLAGEPPFRGPTAQAIVARVMTERPRPLRELRDTVPEALADAVHTALARLPADRFASAREFAAAVDTPAPIFSGGSMHRHQTSRDVAGSGVGAAPARRMAFRAAAGVVLALAAFSTGWYANTTATDTGGPPERRAVLPLSAEFDIRGTDLVAPPDGNMLLITDAGRIVVRYMDRTDVVEVPAPIGALYPFVSDDGTRVGFMAGRDVIVQRLDGSGAITIPGASISGGAFLDDDRIVATDTSGLVILRLSRSERELVVHSDEGTRFLQPMVLPGGRHALMSATRGDLSLSRIVSVDLRSGSVDTLPIGPALRPQYAAGRLYFASPSGALQVVRFDARRARVRGDATPTGEHAVVARQGRVAYAAANGLLAIGARPQTRLVSLTPDGRRIVLLDALGTYHSPRVSPDGRQVVVDRDQGGPRGRDVWILDIATRTMSRVTTVGDGHDPVWTPDGRSVTYLSFSTPGGPIVTTGADGSGGLHQLGPGSAVSINPGAWLPDGSAYIAGMAGDLTNSDIVLFGMDGSIKTVVATRFSEHSPALSPDGQWLAYVSDETGRNQVYVRPLRGGGRIPVSDATSQEPVWTRDGSGLLFVERTPGESRLVRVRIDAAPLRVVERNVVITRLHYEPVGNHSNWDLMPDGSMVFVEPATGTEVVLIFNHRPDAGMR